MPSRSRDWDRVELSVSIQHTPARDGDAVYECLREALPDADVVVDPDTQNPTASTWRTYEECLRTTPRSATHRLVLQDDVCLCTSFIYGVREAIKQRPDSLLSFFISTRPQASATAVLQANDRGETWTQLDARDWVPLQAVVWPVFLIGPMLRFMETKPHAGLSYVADDEMVASFVRARGVSILQSSPCLVEHVHANATSLPIGNQWVNDERKALLFIGDYHPVTDVDWSTGAR